MAVIRNEDPATGKEIVVVKGVVAQIAFKEIANGADKFGNTHRASIRIDDDWINNINIKVKEDFDPAVRFNAGNTVKPDWVNLAVGDEIRIVVQENEYDGKIYMNSGTSKITLVKKGEGVAVKETASGGTVKETYKLRDNSGVLQGHALKGGGTLVSRGLFEDITDASKFFHNVTKVVKDWYAENNNGLDDYSIGNGAGNAVNTAVQYITDVDDLAEEAIRILSEVLPEVISHIQKDKQEPVKEKPTKASKPKATAKKSVAKKEPVVEKEQTDDESFTQGDTDPWDDADIPF